MKKLIRWLGIIATGILFMNTITPMITLADQPVSVKEPLTALYLNQKINNVNKDTIQDANPKITLTSNQTGTYVIPMSKTLFITDQKNQPLKEVQVTDKQSQKAYQEEINAYYKKNSDDQSQKSLLPGDYYQLSLKAHQKLSLNLIGDSNATLNAILLDKNNLPEMFQTVLKYQPKKDDLTDDQSKLFSRLQGNQTNKQLSKLPSLTVQWTRAEKENQKFNNTVQGTKGGLNKASTATKTKTAQGLSKEQSASKKNDKKTMNIKQTAKDQQMKSAKTVSKAITDFNNKTSAETNLLSNDNAIKSATDTNSQPVPSEASKISASPLSSLLSTTDTGDAVHGQTVETKDVYVNSSGYISLASTNAPNVRFTMKLVSEQTGTSPFDSSDGAGLDSNADNDIVRDGDTVTYTVQLTANVIGNQTSQVKLADNFSVYMSPATYEGEQISGTFNDRSYTMDGNDMTIKSPDGVSDSISVASSYGPSDQALNLTKTGQATTFVKTITPENLPNGFQLPVHLSLNADGTSIISLDSIKPLTISNKLKGTLMTGLKGDTISGGSYHNQMNINNKTIEYRYPIDLTGTSFGSDFDSPTAFDASLIGSNNGRHPDLVSYDSSISGKYGTSDSGLPVSANQDYDSDATPQLVNKTGNSAGSDQYQLRLDYTDPNDYRPGGSHNSDLNSYSLNNVTSNISNIKLYDVWGEAVQITPTYSSQSASWRYSPSTSNTFKAALQPTLVHNSNSNSTNWSDSTVDKNRDDTQADYTSIAYSDNPADGVKNRTSVKTDSADGMRSFAPNISIFSDSHDLSSTNPTEVPHLDVMARWNPNAYKYSKAFESSSSLFYDNDDNVIPFEYGVANSSNTSDSTIDNATEDDYTWYTKAQIDQFSASQKANISAIRVKSDTAYIKNYGSCFDIPVMPNASADSTGSHLPNGQTRLIVANVSVNGRSLLQKSPITTATGYYNGTFKGQVPSASDDNWIASYVPSVSNNSVTAFWFKKSFFDNGFDYNDNANDYTTNDVLLESGQNTAYNGDAVVSARFFGLNTLNNVDFSKVSDAQLAADMKALDPSINMHFTSNVLDTSKTSHFYLDGEPITLSTSDTNFGTSTKVKTIDFTNSENMKALRDAIANGYLNKAQGIWITSSPLTVTLDDVINDKLWEASNWYSQTNNEDSSAELNLSTKNQIGVNESIDQSRGSKNSEYTVTVNPYTTSSISESNMRGIITLPHSGDSTGSSFSGTDLLKKIDVINANNHTIDFWYSTITNEGRNPSTNISNDTAGNWQKLTDLTNIPSDAKSIAYQIEGSSANTEYDFNLVYQTSGNQDWDIYQNNSVMNSDSEYTEALKSPTVGYLIYDPVYAEIDKVDGTSGQGLANATFKLANSVSAAQSGNYLYQYKDYIFNATDAAKVWSAIAFDVNDDGTVDSYDYQDWLSSLSKATFTTDSNGKASVRVPDGRDYYAVETQAPNGYNLANPTKLTLSSNSSNITPTNIKDYNNGTLTLDKVAQDTGANLTGAKFKIYDSDGNEVTQDDNGNSLNLTTTGSDGKYQQINVSLKPGTYTVVETKAPTGYELFKQAKTFTITGGKTTNISFSDAAEIAFPKAGGSLWKTIFLIALVIISSITGYCFERRSKHKHLEN